MKLENAKLHEQEIKEAFWKVWYDERYQYYFDGYYRRDYKCSDGYNDYPCFEFAVLDDESRLIGLIGYKLDSIVNVAFDLFAINFTDNKIDFALALRQVVTDCFNRYGVRVLEWRVVCGNPAEEGYDRLCKMVGGHVVGIRHKRRTDMSGRLLDEKIYEVDVLSFNKATGH